MKMAESRSEVDVADLQRSLRECIERVRAGEQVILTDGGRPVARLSPIAGPADPARCRRRRTGPDSEGSPSASAADPVNGPVSDFLAEQGR